MIAPNNSMFPTRYGEVSGVQAQKLQRLRVNRVAIVQALKVEHVIPYLLEKQTLTPDDKETILKTKTSQDKARKLIDVLPRKGKEVDWYQHFRDALLNPDTRSNEVKKRYSMLIDFMENTILPKRCDSADGSCDSEMKLPRYDPLPDISSSGSPTKNKSNSRVAFNVGTNENTDCSELGDGDGASDAGDQKPVPKQPDAKEAALKEKRLLLKGFFHKWVNPPEDFTSLIQPEVGKLELLEASSDPDDEAQLVMEKQAMEKLRNLEVVLVLNRKGELPNGFEVCMSSAAEELLADSSLFHLYFKYFNHLTTKHNLNIPLELAVSFTNLTTSLGDAADEDGREFIVKMGFGLFDLLSESAMYHRAESVMTELVIHLASSSAMEAWVATWEAFVKLMVIRNMNVNFSEADAVYFAAQQMSTKIKMMSFGKDLLDESELFVGLSTLMREQGSISSSYKWAQESLKEVDTDNQKGIVDVLCNASLAYGNKLSVKKAEELVLQAVRHARKLFGVRHPVYIKALLHFCHHSNEFRQDDMGVAVARKAVSLCGTVYGDVINIQKAEAQQALAKALMVNHQFTDDEYFESAKNAWRMALDVLEGGHPRIALFSYTLAQSLMWRAGMCSDPDTAVGNLIWAETEAKGALATFRTYWGESSMKVAQGNALLGQISAKLGKTEDAESILLNNMTLHNIAFPRNSHYTYLARATLGTFYKTIDKPIEALEHLGKVVDAIDCQGVYLRWVHICFDTVIEILNAVDRKKEADHYQDCLVDWMRRHPKPSHQLTWTLLDAEPLETEAFYESINTWETKLKAAKRGLRNLKLTFTQYGSQQSAGNQKET